jgi:hypothetical protein
MGYRIAWSGRYPYRTVWILTLKRIYAEGLQQKR